LNAETCERYLDWLLAKDAVAAPEGATGLDRALAHCDDGVTWGRFDASAKVWRLGNQAAPEVSPPLRLETLQELRLFGEAGEVLIWRTEEGPRGRSLREGPRPADGSDDSDPLRPMDESRILRGDRVVEQYRYGFTQIGDRAGAAQVVPLEVTAEQLQERRLRLQVRHYYEQDPESGAVRIAATRLVTLTSGGIHGA